MKAVDFQRLLSKLSESRESRSVRETWSGRYDVTSANCCLMSLAKAFSSRDGLSNISRTSSHVASGFVATHFSQTAAMHLLVLLLCSHSMA